MSMLLRRYHDDAPEEEVQEPKQEVQKEEVQEPKQEVDEKDLPKHGTDEEPKKSTKKKD
jgi:hypothetical protein